MLSLTAWPLPMNVAATAITTVATGAANGALRWKRSGTAMAGAISGTSHSGPLLMPSLPVGLARPSTKPTPPSTIARISTHQARATAAARVTVREP